MSTLYGNTFIDDNGVTKNAGAAIGSGLLTITQTASLATDSIRMTDTITGATGHAIFVKWKWSAVGGANEWWPLILINGTTVTKTAMPAMYVSAANVYVWDGDSGTDTGVTVSSNTYYYARAIINSDGTVTFSHSTTGYSNWTVLGSSVVADSFNAAGTALRWACGAAAFNAGTEILTVDEMFYTNNGTFSTYVQAYANAFTALTDFTSVVSDAVNTSLTIVSGELRSRRTAGASSTFNTLGIYSTAAVASRTLVAGDYFLFDTRASAADKDFMVLFKDDAGIDYNAGTRRGGLYGEGSGGGATNLKVWNKDATAGAGIGMTAATTYRFKAIIDLSGTMTIHVKDASASDNTYARVGSTTTAKVPTYVGQQIMFATNHYYSDSDIFFDNFELWKYVENATGGDGTAGGGNMLLLLGD